MTEQSFKERVCLMMISMANLILRKRSDKKLFDEIILGDANALTKYRGKIKNLLAEEFQISNFHVDI